LLTDILETVYRDSY